MIAGLAFPKPVPDCVFRNAASEMEKRDNRAFDARPVVGSRDDRLNEMSRRLSIGGFMTLGWQLPSGPDVRVTTRKRR